MSYSLPFSLAIVFAFAVLITQSFGFTIAVCVTFALGYAVGKSHGESRTDGHPETYR